MSKTQRIETTMEVVRTLVGLLIAYGVALVILFAISDDPVYIVKQFILGPFSSPRRIGSIINLAIPFTICGLSMCFMYAVNRFNLVAEGIFMLSGCMVTFTALKLGGDVPAAVMWWAQSPVWRWHLSPPLWSGSSTPTWWWCP